MPESARAAEPGSRPAPVPYLLWRLSRSLRRHPGWFVALGRLETRILGDRLAGRPIDRPVFVTGLARAGTTIMLELLASLDGVATHRYRDFPFVHAPVLWDRFLRRAARPGGEPVERLHQDGILITPESPEALDEPIWMSFFPDAHDPARSAVLEDVAAPGFADFYRAHLAKLLLLRGGDRIVLKANYALSRLGYLARLLPGARFVVMVRDPVEHVGSMMRQQRLFAQRQTADPRARDYLAALGHFEFGLDRRPVNFGSDRAIAAVLAAWSAGDEVGGWARYWRHVHLWLAERLAADPLLAEAVLVVRSGSLTADPVATLERVLLHCGLEHRAAAALAARLKAPRPHAPDLGDDAVRAIREVTREVAARFGYGAAGLSRPAP